MPAAIDGKCPVGPVAPDRFDHSQELQQVHIEGRWKTFDETVDSREGTSLLYEYRFRRTYRPTTYPFRVAMPATGSGDYPYTSGTSNVVKVRVNP